MNSIRRAINESFKLYNTGTLQGMLIITLGTDDTILFSLSGSMSKLEEIGLCHYAIEHIVNREVDE
jgi:DNA-directed RNA polymerase subunit L